MVLERQPVGGGGPERRVLQRTADADRDDRPRRRQGLVRLDLRAHPAWRLQGATVDHDHQQARAVQRFAQGAVEPLAGRGFLFAEEDREVALAQPARQVGGVAETTAWRRAEGEGDEDVVAEPARGAVAAGAGRAASRRAGAALSQSRHRSGCVGLHRRSKVRGVVIGTSVMKQAVGTGAIGRGLRHQAPGPCPVAMGEPMVRGADCFVQPWKDGDKQGVRRVRCR